MVGGRDQWLPRRNPLLVAEDYRTAVSGEILARIAAIVLLSSPISAILVSRMPRRLIMTNPPEYQVLNRHVTAGARFSRWHFVAVI